MRTDCPKCRFTLDSPAESCPACGVVFAKLGQSSARRQTPDSGFVTRETFGPRCQSCGSTGKTVLAHFRQNVGMLVARQEKHIEGNLCRACTGKYFWQLTLTTAAVGWLGTVSLIVAPIYVIMNIATYVRSLGELARA